MQHKNPLFWQKNEEEFSIQCAKHCFRKWHLRQQRASKCTPKKMFIRFRPWNETKMKKNKTKEKKTMRQCKSSVWIYLRATFSCFHIPSSLLGIVSLIIHASSNASCAFIKQNTAAQPATPKPKWTSRLTNASASSSQIQTISWTERIYMYDVYIFEKKKKNQSGYEIKLYGRENNARMKIP